MRSETERVRGSKRLTPWYWVFVGLLLAAFALSVLESQTGGIRIARVIPGLVVVGLLIFGLARGSRVCWVLLMLSGLFSALAVRAIEVDGSTPSTAHLVFATLSLAQVAVLATPQMRALVGFSRKAGAG
jgi:hypothetical protein